MPQLDFYSIGNQFFWGIITFILFFYITARFVVPALYVSIFTRLNGTTYNENTVYEYQYCRLNAWRGYLFFHKECVTQLINYGKAINTFTSFSQPLYSENFVNEIFDSECMTLNFVYNK
jgi:hypothetical protein